MISQAAEQKAIGVLREFKIKTVPVRVEDIADKSGIKIGRAPSKDFDGFLLRKDGQAFIGVNSRDPLTRQRFTIAHELGHYFLHKNKKAFVDYPANNVEVLFRGSKKETTRSVVEIEANRFAAALLMPSLWLEKDFDLLRKNEVMPLEEKVSFLAEKYKVSREAMTYRLMDLKLS